MKTKHWVILIAALLVICTAAAVWLYRPRPQAAQIEIVSDGKLLYTLPLNQDKELTVTSPYGTNVITFRNGKVAVTEADCPDGYCKARGWCDGGTQIVCLPHRLVITFLGDSPIDGVAG